MFTIQQCKISLAIAALMASSGVMAATMTKADYATAKTRISSDYKVDKAACDKSTGNAKDICVEQAKGKQEVARAELEYGYTGKAKDGNKVGIAQADATYAVAKEMCDDKSGQAKTLCRTEAKATHTKAIADAKMTKKVIAAKVEAVDEKRDANYKVAIEKCDSLAGDPKSACIAAAKATYNKN